jgi:hypothetical protein
LVTTEVGALVVTVVVEVIETSLVTVLVVTTIRRVVEVNDRIGVAAVVVVVVEAVSGATAEQATEIREGEHVKMDAGVWMATSRFLPPVVTVAVDTKLWVWMSVVYDVLLIRLVNTEIEVTVAGTVLTVLITVGGM